ncbi:hypothetical protein Agub_g10074 [Astrephomene gubernaculifera]|uniref:Uncharacterized protein n=1 Tax=Astrephomene gubernaculifera TaxID=47775 RepID=A0AAD3HNR8_9CHLO|nr:hypothetical protein Agub_g10074 [Astrephomene gubernaculifera]
MSNLRGNTPSAQPATDTYNPDNDPHRLLKLSHSLRYQLAQPLRRHDIQQNPSLPAPGVGYPHGPHGGARQPLSPQASRPHPPQSHHSPQQQQQPQQSQPPPLQGPGTRSGPYSGFASKDWLQSEVRQDVDSLRRHVDEHASKREQRAFELERAALQAEIAHLRSRLAASEERAVKLEMMLPNENGEFRRLRAEVEELEREADQFSMLYERHAAATKSALAGYRQALADMDDIEQEFTRIQRLVDSLPEATASGRPVSEAAGAGYASMYPGLAHAYSTQAPSRPTAAAPGAPPSSAGGTPPRPGVCCGCFPVRRR